MSIQTPVRQDGPCQGMVESATVLSEIDPAVGDHGVVDEPEPLGSVFGPEPFIVFPEHHHVDVVVPGNESLVSDSAQEGAVAQ